MLHGVAGERGVIGFEVQFEVFEQIVFAEEVQAGGGVGIVLVLGRFFRLRLDVELALEADLLLVIDRHVQERGQMIQLPASYRCSATSCSLRARPRTHSLRRPARASLRGLSSPAPRR